jgi:hypothetical protein
VPIVPNPLEEAALHCLRSTKNADAAEQADLSQESQIMVVVHCQEQLELAPHLAAIDPIILALGFHIERSKIRH